MLKDEGRLTDDMIVSKSFGQATHDLDFEAVIVLWKWLDFGRFAPGRLELRDTQVKPSYWVSGLETMWCMRADLSGGSGLEREP